MANLHKQDTAANGEGLGERGETLVWAGHVSSRAKKCSGTSRLFARFLPHCLCHLEIEVAAIAVRVAMFYSSLQVAISGSRYCNLNLKLTQVQCLEAIYSGRDVIAVLPTAYDKSLIFHLLPPPLP